MNQQSPFADTIFALSSGRLPAGVAVIRVSGPDVTELCDRVCGGVTEPRRMEYRRVSSGDGHVIDHGLVVFFPGPASFTGEDCVEFHLHGGKAVVFAFLELLGSMKGMRAAEAGEFTRRAFVNGKIDLTGAEALSDLISAETESQRRLALENARGGQRKLYDSWRERILYARAMIEAELDFSDEEDVPGSVASEVWSDMVNLRADIVSHIGGYRRSEIIREGFKVAIIGAPNAGKSSLINALARRDVVIVSDEAGTTRDVVSVTLDLDGIAVVVSDTAGIREDAGTVEKLGIERARKEAAAADLVLLLRDSSSGGRFDIPETEAEIITVLSKGDLLYASSEDLADLTVSAVTGEGIDRLLVLLGEKAAMAVGSLEEGLPGRIRHVRELEQASEYLQMAVSRDHDTLELRAEALRLASNCLGRITGRINVEDVLDVVFGAFCIGK